MKKVLFFAAAVAAMMLASCKPSEYEVVVNDPADANLVTITITANLDQATKATINDAEKKWVWSEGDHLAVFDGVAKRDFTLTAGAGTAIATFTGSISGSGESLQAIFPYAAAAGDDFAAGYVIPAAQTVTAEAVVDPNALVATATGAKDGDDYNFTFTSAVSFIRFTSAAADKFIFHAVDKEDSLTGDGRAVVVNAPAAGTWWVAVKPASYTGIRVFRRISGHDYMLSSASTLDLATPGKAREFGTINSTANEVVVIETADELVSYLKSEPTLDAYVCADLDLTAKSVTTCDSYALTFDGQGHKLSNWSSAGVSLFGMVGAAGRIKNLTIDDSCELTAVNPGNNAFIAKALQGRIDNCHNKAPVTLTLNSETEDENGDPASGIQSHKIGSLVGRMTDHSAQLFDCTNTGDFTVTVNIIEAMGGDQYIGGIVGLVGDPDEAVVVRLDGCSNSGAITVNATVPSEQGWLKNHFIGGVAGATGVNSGSSEKTSDFTLYYGELRNCENNGAVSATWQGGTGGYFKVGGIIGYSEGALFDCTNRGSVSFTSSNTVSNAGPSVGGIAAVLAGKAPINAKDCLNTGVVSLSGMFGNAGQAYFAGEAGCTWATCGGCFGTVGDNATIVQNCNNTGSVHVDASMLPTAGSSSSFGGVIGVSMAEVQDCDFSSASPSSFSGMSKNCHMGGIVGYAYMPVSDCDFGTPLTCVFDEESLTTNKGSCIHNVGGIVGYGLAGATVSDCSTTSTASLTVNTTGEMRLGGIVGMSYVAVSGCTNLAPITLTRKYLSDVAYKNYIGGIVGLQNGNYVITNCSNGGNMDITLESKSSTSYTAGIVSYTKGNEVSDCTNSGNITLDGGSMTKQNFVCGIVCWNNITASFTNCSNTGDISVSNWASTSFNYIAGICGNYNADGGATNNTYSNLSNSGNITSTAASKMRMGGIASAVNCGATLTNIANTGNVTVSNALASSQVGGLVGYWGKGSFNTASNSGIINVSAANTSVVSTMVGSLNVNSTWTDIVVGGSVETNSGNKAGTLLGAFNATGKKLTLSGTKTITATVNGAAPTSDNAVGNLNSSTLSGY